MLTKIEYLKLQEMKQKEVLELEDTVSQGLGGLGG